jgi:integrase/recombinase XerD
VAASLDVGIQQFLDHLRVERELTPATVEAYGRDLSVFARFVANRKLEAAGAVRPIDVLDFLVHLTDRKLTARSQARRLIALRQLFKFLKAERVIGGDPTEDVDLPRYGRKLPDFLSVEEVDALLAAPDRLTARGARDAAMLETLYATGLRVSELVTLRLRDVNF